MLASLSPTTPKSKPKLRWSAGVFCALLGFSALPATAVAGEPTACEAHAYSQPFTAFNDFNYYKLVQGGNFNSPAEGWELSGGAQIIHTTRPDGSTGGVLNIAGGARAVSPPVPVTLLDPTARVWVRDVKGAEGVAVSVAYAGTNTALQPKNVGHVHGQHDSWTLSTPFNVQPQTAGPEEGVRIVRFHFDAGGRTNDTELYGLWVDPRMRGESRMPTQGGCGSIGGTLIRGSEGGGTTQPGVS